MNRPKTYFHGTNGVDAVEAILAGEPLRFVAQAGARAARMRGSDPGMVHLAPAISVAAKYAKAITRTDRPSRDYGSIRPLGVVFAFEPAPDAVLLPDEDDLGWAVRLAAEGRHYGSGPARFVERMIFNRGFAAALAADASLVAAFETEAADRLPGSVLALLDVRIAPTAASIARLGRALRDRLSPETLEAVVCAGASVATPDELVPVAAYEWDDAASRGLGIHLPFTMEDFLRAASEIPLPGPAAVAGPR